MNCPICAAHLIDKRALRADLMLARRALTQLQDRLDAYIETEARRRHPTHRMFRAWRHNE